MKTRYYPSDCQIVMYPEDVEVGIKTHKMRLSAIVYTGKKTKSEWYYCFTTKDSMNEKIQKLIEDIRANKKRKEEYKEAQKKRKQELKSSMKVGDILHTSFGYDQTMNYFFQVTGFKGSKVLVREIGKINIKGTDGFMSCQVKADVDNFIGEEKAYTICAWGIKVMYDYYASPCDKNQEFYESWYA